MSEELYTYLNTLISDSVSTGKEGGTRSRLQKVGRVCRPVVGTKYMYWECRDSMSISIWLCCPKGLGLASLVSGGGLGVTTVWCCGRVVIPSWMKWGPQVRVMVVQLSRRGIQYICLCELFSMVVMCVRLLTELMLIFSLGWCSSCQIKNPFSQL
jgi:hypothetical protein